MEAIDLATTKNVPKTHSAGAKNWDQTVGCETYGAVFARHRPAPSFVSVASGLMRLMVWFRRSGGRFTVVVMLRPSDPLTTPLNMAQAGRVLGVASQTVRRMIEQGDLDATRVAGPCHDKVAYEITHEQIEDYLDRCRVQPGELTKLWDQSGDLEFV